MLELVLIPLAKWKLNLELMRGCFCWLGLGKKQNTSLGGGDVV